MDKLGNDLFAGAAFPGNQDRNIGVRQPSNAFLNCRHHGSFSKDRIVGREQMLLFFPNRNGFHECVRRFSWQ